MLYVEFAVWIVREQLHYQWILLRQNIKLDSLIIVDLIFVDVHEYWELLGIFVLEQNERNEVNESDLRQGVFINGSLFNREDLEEMIILNLHFNLVLNNQPHNLVVLLVIHYLQLLSHQV